MIVFHIYIYIYIHLGNDTARRLFHMLFVYYVDKGMSQGYNFLILFSDDQTLHLINFFCVISKLDELQAGF